MASKVLNYEEFIEYAKKFYEKGGDSYVECWGHREFDEYVERCGRLTKKDAREMFRLNYEIERDRMGWGW